MLPTDLPRLGPPQNTEKDWLRFVENIASVRNKKILCVGYSEAELKEFVVKYRPRDITVLTKWEDHPDAAIKAYPLVIGDLTAKTPFGEEEFDAVLTFSVLEHLADIDAAFQEMNRILKPDGYSYHFFGPVWSGPYGHHVYAKPGDSLLDFSVWQMPAYLHLLCQPHHIAEYYRKNGYTVDDVETAFHWFYESPIMNRLMYEDYARCFSRHGYVVMSEHMYHVVPDWILAKLRQRFAPYCDFSSYGAKCLLRRLAP
jgi:SAM-dependent methyltransferase